MNETLDIFTPGQLLQSARQGYNLSVAEIASRLRLSEHIITNLEKDQYAQMGALAYVRGYLRAYARLVDLPADKVIQAFEHLAEAEQLIPSTHSVSQQEPTSDKKGLFDRFELKGRLPAWVKLAFAGSLVLLVVIWWYGQRDSSKLDVSVPAELSVPAENASAGSISSAPANSSAPSTEADWDKMEMQVQAINPSIAHSPDAKRK